MARRKKRRGTDGLANGRSGAEEVGLPLPHELRQNATGVSHIGREHICEGKHIPKWS